MTKVAFSIGTLAIGGAEVFTVNLLTHLDYRRFQVLLIVLGGRTGSYLEDMVANLPLEVIYINKPEGFHPGAFFRIIRLLMHFHPDILHGNIGGVVYFLGYLMIRPKTRMIYTAHTLAHLEFGKFKQKIISHFIHKKRIIPIGTSSAVTESLKAVYRVSDVKTIMNGIDCRRFRAVRDRRIHPVTIGHVGRFEEVKNHETIVAVYRKLKRHFPDIRLKMIGDGSLFEMIRSLVDHDPDVVMIRSSPNIPEELKGIDIFFFPSLYEGMPLSLIEAMASGCAVIASAVGGIRDLIENGINGFLIDDPEDHHAFYEAFAVLLKNWDKIIEFSENNSIRAQNYDLKAMVLQYQELYSGGIEC